MAILLSRVELFEQSDRGHYREVHFCEILLNFACRSEDMTMKDSSIFSSDGYFVQVSHMGESSKFPKS